MSYISSTEKNNLISDLIELAKSDGIFNMAEMSYLIWVANKLEVSQLELSQLMKKEPSRFGHVSVDQRLEHLYRMLNMIFVDGSVEMEEVEKCKEMAYKMGLDRYKVDVYMADLMENPAKVSNLEILKESFDSI